MLTCSSSKRINISPTRLQFSVAKEIINQSTKKQQEEIPTFQQTQQSLPDIVKLSEDLIKEMQFIGQGLFEEIINLQNDPIDLSLKYKPKFQFEENDDQLNQLLANPVIDHKEIDLDYVEAEQKIIDNADRIGLDLNEVSNIFEDIVIQSYMFKSLNLVCFYPIQQLSQLIRMISLEQNGITILITKDKYIENLPHFDTYEDMKSEEIQAYQITQTEFKMRSLSSFPSISSIIQLCPPEQETIMFPEQIYQQIIIVPNVFPCFLMNEFLAANQIKTQHFGPLLKADPPDKDQLEKQNYKIKKSYFLEPYQDKSIFECLKLLLSIITQQGIVMIYTRNKDTLQKLDEFLLNEEFRYVIFGRKILSMDINLEIILVNQLNNVPLDITQRVSSIIHLDFPPNLYQYANDLLFIPEQCQSYVFLNKQSFYKERNKIIENFIDDETFNKIINYIIGEQQEYNLFHQTSIKRKIKIQDLAEKFNLKNRQIIQIVQQLEKKGSIKNIKLCFTQLRTTLVNNLDPESQDIQNIITRTIQLIGRRLISLRQEKSLMAHYQVDLHNLAQHLGIDLDDLISILQRSPHYFTQNEFFDEILYYQSYGKIDEEQNKEMISQHNIYIQTKLSDIDYMFNFAKLHILTQSRFTEAFKPVEELFQLFKKNFEIYFQAQERFEVQQIFPEEFNQDIHKTIQQIKGLNQIKKDIDVFLFFFECLNKQKELNKLNSDLNARQLLFILLGICNQVTKAYRFNSLWAKYQQYDIDQMIKVIKNYVNQKQQDDDSRQFGWVFKKIKK